MKPAYFEIKKNVWRLFIIKMEEPLGKNPKLDNEKSAVCPFLVIIGALFNKSTQRLFRMIYLDLLLLFYNNNNN